LFLQTKEQGHNPFCQSLFEEKYNEKTRLEKSEEKMTGPIDDRLKRHNAESDKVPNKSTKETKSALQNLVRF
jgi:hypothetical protein